MINRIAVLSAFCLLLVPPLSFEQANTADEDDLIVKARAFIDALGRGDFETAARDFDATMMKLSGPDKLAEFWKQVPERLGAFKRRTATRRKGQTLKAQIKRAEFRSAEKIVSGTALRT
jgi:hypothetical protein